MKDPTKGSQTQATHRLPRPELSVRSFQVVVTAGASKDAKAAAAEDRMTIGSAQGNDLVVDDPTVSRFHVELVRTGAGIRVEDLSSKNGTFLGPARIERAVVPVGAELQIGTSRLVIHDGQQAKPDAHELPCLGDLYGSDPQMRRLMARIEKVSKTSVSVLVTGESGTGKELVARAIHDSSDRRAGPFVVVDCGALTPTLVASALFGHERGAFTGADREHQGAFERADGGTLFLDEIGELPMELQPQLLGVLQRRRFLRLGAKNETATDVRIVCATNRDLRREINQSTFREDLYFRLAVVNLELPPLRERKSDIMLLVEHFMREMGSPAAIEDVFSDDSQAHLMAHTWPGNVRELRNYVEATVAMGEPPPAPTTPSRPPPTDALHLPSELLDLSYGAARSSLLDEFERAYAGSLLERTNGNVSKAAREAKMDRSYLIKILQKHGLR